MPEALKMLAATGPIGAQPARKAGVGDSAGNVPLDPVSDAVSNLGALQAYFAVVQAGSNPTASQLAAAQAALATISADLKALQLAGPPGPQVWVSAPAAAGVALGMGVVGGLIGYVVGGKKKKE